MSSKPVSECRRVLYVIMWWELLAMPVLWQSAKSYSTRYAIINLLNFVTTNHPMNHIECHLQHALSSTRRSTFNRNVVKLLAFVL